MFHHQHFTRYSFVLPQTAKSVPTYLHYGMKLTAYQNEAEIKMKYGDAKEKQN